MDIVFDIDGTLADATHRLHWIQDPAYWDYPGEGKLPRPNWGMFLSDELVQKDSYIPETWLLMRGLLGMGARLVFITGRPDSQRELTWTWLCGGLYRPNAFLDPAHLYMRKTGDRRPSHEIKRELLAQARLDGFSPTIAFEDRIDDTKMWRSEGLRCFQVAEGNY